MKWRSPPFKVAKTLLSLTIAASLCGDVIAKEGNWTEIHEVGRCAIRGQCGKKSFFGGELPCPDNRKAEAPDEDTRKKLVAICGDEWSDGDVCCDSAQVRSC
jgi:Niemann-Pick C1 protein